MFSAERKDPVLPSELKGTKGENAVTVLWSPLGEPDCQQGRWFRARRDEPAQQLA